MRNERCHRRVPQHLLVRQWAPIWGAAVGGFHQLVVVLNSVTQTARQGLTGVTTESVIAATGMVIAAAISLYALLIYTALETAFSLGICCADDEAMATIAKNLAFGYGYSVSVSWNGVPGLFPFDWGTLSTGPTLLIPAALFISVFGNQPWVPGLTTVIEISFLFALLAVAHARRATAWEASGYMLLLGLIVFALTSPWFVTWYALLGEMPAALLAVLGGTLWVGRLQDRTTIAVSSLCFGLAVMAKVLALLGFLPMVAWLTWQFLRDRTGRRMVLLLTSLTFFLLPILAFELWKLVTLGVTGYLSFWSEGLHFITSQGTSDSALQDVIGRVAAKLTVFRDNFNQSAPLLLGLLLGSAVFALRAKDARPLYLYFATAALFHWSWWLFVSPPSWPRYMVIGLVYQAAAMASLAYAVRRFTLLVPGVTVAMVYLLYPNPMAATWMVRASLQNRFQENASLTHLRDAAAFLQRLPDDHQLVTGFWTAGVGLEYMLPSVGNFLRYDAVPISSKRAGSLYLARNDRPQFNDFADWERFCSEVVFDEAPYVISRCPQFPVNAELEKLANSPDPSGRPAKLRFQNGSVNLLAEPPSSLTLAIVPGRYRRLHVTFGMDVATWEQGTTDGVCFVVEEIGDTSMKSELLRECLQPLENKNDRMDRTTEVNISPTASQLTFSTSPRAINSWDWAYWKDIRLEP